MVNPIVKALKESLTVRVYEDGRWLVWSTDNKAWQVYRPIPKTKQGHMVCSTPKLDTAVEYLLGKR